MVRPSKIINSLGADKTAPIYLGHMKKTLEELANDLNDFVFKYAKENQIPHEKIAAFYVSNLVNGYVESGLSQQDMDKLCGWMKEKFSWLREQKNKKIKE